MPLIPPIWQSAVNDIGQSGSPEMVQLARTERFAETRLAPHAAWRRSKFCLLNLAALFRPLL